MPIAESVGDQVGWDSEQDDLVEDVPAHGRGAPLDQMIFKGPFQPKLQSYDSVILRIKNAADPFYYPNKISS